MIWIQKPNQSVKKKKNLSYVAGKLEMESCFSCQSWLSHQPMPGGLVPQTPLLTPSVCQESPFGFVVLQLSLHVLPCSLPVDGSVVAHKTVWQSSQSSDLLTHLLSAEMSFY